MGSESIPLHTVVDLTPMDSESNPRHTVVDGLTVYAWKQGLQLCLVEYGMESLSMHRNKIYYRV